MADRPIFFQPAELNSFAQNSTAQQILNEYTQLIKKKLKSPQQSVSFQPSNFKYQLGGMLVYDSTANINFNSSCIIKTDSPQLPNLQLSAAKKYLLNNALRSDVVSYQNMPFYSPSPSFQCRYGLQVPIDSGTLAFNSKFESGNLYKAIKLSDYQYVLYLQNDTGTPGNNHWYYFSVSNQKKQTVTFKIANMYKPDVLYGQGMLPAVYSCKQNQRHKTGWKRDCFCISYQHNKFNSNFHTLSFSYTFQHMKDTVYFAYSVPYTFREMQKELQKIKQEKAEIARVDQICRTLADNPCYMLTITQNIRTYISFEQQIEQWGISAAGRKLKKFREMKAERLAKLHKKKDLFAQHAKKKGVVLTSRVHSGQTVGSFMMQGTIEFLLGQSKQAKTLRKNYIFKIIPMLNPDGVRYGNYRASLLGIDLNRRWLSPNKILHPTIFYTKKMLEVFHQKQEVVLFCDYHGHSRKKNVFMYGCHKKQIETLARRKSLLAKVIPVLMHHRNPFFNFKDCSFRMQKAKKGTARMVVWKQFDIAHSYTMEGTSFGPSNLNSFGENYEGDPHMQIEHYKSLGEDLCKICLGLISHRVYMKKVQFTYNYLRGLTYKTLKSPSRNQKIKENISDISQIVIIDNPKEIDQIAVQQGPEKFYDIYTRQDLWEAINLTQEVIQEVQEQDSSSDSDEPYQSKASLYDIEKEPSMKFLFEDLKQDIRQSTDYSPVLQVQIKRTGQDTPLISSSLSLNYSQIHSRQINQQFSRGINQQNKASIRKPRSIRPQKTYQRYQRGSPTGCQTRFPQQKYTGSPQRGRFRTVQHSYQRSISNNLGSDIISEKSTSRLLQQQNDTGKRLLKLDESHDSGLKKRIFSRNSQINSKRTSRNTYNTPRINMRKIKKEYTDIPTKVFRFQQDYSLDFTPFNMTGRQIAKNSVRYSTRNSGIPRISSIMK